MLQRAVKLFLENIPQSLKKAYATTEIIKYFSEVFFWQYLTIFYLVVTN